MCLDLYPDFFSLRNPQMKKQKFFSEQKYFSEAPWFILTPQDPPTPHLKFVFLVEILIIMLWMETIVLKLPWKFTKQVNKNKNSGYLIKWKEWFGPVSRAVPRWGQFVFLFYMLFCVFGFIKNICQSTPLPPSHHGWVVTTVIVSSIHRVL